MAANFNPYQAMYAKQNDAGMPIDYANMAHGSAPSMANSSMNNNTNQYTTGSFMPYTNQTYAMDPYETTVNMPLAHNDLNMGLSANQVNHALNNMAFVSSFGDLSARSSRRSNDMFAMSHDLSSQSHYNLNHLHTNDRSDEYSLDVNQISELLNDNDYLPNMSQPRPISKSEILSELKSTIAPVQNSMLSSNHLELPMSGPLMNSATHYHRDSTTTNADMSPESSSTSTQYSPDNCESNCSSVQWINSNGLNDMDGRIDVKRAKRHVPESSPASYTSTLYSEPKRQYHGPDYSKNRDLNENNEFPYDGLNFDNDQQNVISSPLSATSKSNAFEMPPSTLADNQSQSKANKNISFTPWNTGAWAQLYTFDHKLIEKPLYEVEADKGFYYSNFDDAFVCQKKNHFQITVRCIVSQQPVYIKLQDDNTFHKIDKCYLRLYGLKQESPTQKIPIKQYDKDRKSTDYEAPECKLVPMESCKFTKKRLHFAHTTHNNNRKKNLPNPDQRYFLLVVEVEAITTGKQSFSLCSFASERIIVRAVNPGQFKQDAPGEDSFISNQPMSRHASLVPNVQSPEEIPKITPKIEMPSGASPDPSVMSDQTNSMKTQRLSENITSNNLTHFGNFGINTANPDEALTVVGNVKIIGNVLNPSDYRVKENFKPIDENQALENVKKIQLYKYDFKKEFVNEDGKLKSEIGVIAQDLQRIIPDAIVESGDAQLTNGETVNKLLLVDKNRLNMECVGALKALGNKTENLDQKIVRIEEFIEKSVTINAAELMKGPMNGGPGQPIPGTYQPPPKGFGSLSQYFRLTGRQENREQERKLIRAYKILLAISLTVIALGIIGILVVMIVQHNYNVNSNSKTNSTSNPTTESNDTYNYYYPVIAPPPISSPNCPQTKTCKYCCQYSSNNSSKSDSSRQSRVQSQKSHFNNTSDFFDNLPFDDENSTDLEVQEVSETILNSTDFVFSNIVANQIGPDKSLLGIVLYSRDPFIFVNLSTNGNCNSPYCEKLNGINYYFLPISQNVDLQTHFNLVFYLTNQYNLKYCNTDNNAQLCPNFKIDTVMFDTSKSTLSESRLMKNTTTSSYDVNDYQFQANNIKQYAYLTPISYFLHVDYIFRIYPSKSNYNIDVCIFKSSQYNPSLSNLYQEYVFRFYRLC